MKKITSLILLVSIAFSIASCGEKIIGPKDSINNFFEAINTYDETKIIEYSNDESLTNLVKKSEDNNGIDKDLIVFLFNNLSYSITNVTENGDAATADIEITNTDMKNIMSKFMKEVISFAFSEEATNEITDEELKTKYKKILSSIIDENKDITVTNSVSVNLIKSNKNWKIEINKDLTNAITGDLANVADSYK